MRALSSSKFQRQIEALLGKSSRCRRSYSPWCRWLSKLATALVFAAMLLLFLIILWWFPSRSLLIVLFLLFLALLGMVC